MKKGTLEKWHGTACVFGVDWGDSGKGRLIDDLAHRAHIIARYAGGSNTGHTVKNSKGEFALHIVPSGIFNQKATCLVGKNVAVDLESLVLEIKTLEKAGVSTKNLVIDRGASVTMPWHKMRDGLREKLRGGKLGTTGKGVGATYADRTERVGLLISDIVSRDFEKKLKEEISIQNSFYKLNLNTQEIFKKYQQIAKRIKQYVGDTQEVLDKALNANKNILFEGAQGVFLDIDFGTYPFVTSSNPGVVGIWRCFDLHPSKINEVIGITKAYMTRVGEGPMPTEIEDNVADRIIEKGREFGTTTGRKRRPGWSDLVLIKSAHMANRLSALAITKLDVLSGLDSIKVCTAYRVNGKTQDYIRLEADFLKQVRPVYEELPGWSEDISQVRDFKNLPVNAQNFIKTIEEVVGVPVKIITVGPQRGQVIYV